MTFLAGPVDPIVLVEAMLPVGLEGRALTSAGRKTGLVAVARVGVEGTPALLPGRVDLT